MLTPGFDEHLGLLEHVGNPCVQKFAFEFAEGFDEAIIRGTTGVDKQSLDLESLKPVSNRLSADLRTVMRSAMFGWSSLIV